MTSSPAPSFPEGRRARGSVLTIKPIFVLTCQWPAPLHPVASKGMVNQAFHVPRHVGIFTALLAPLRLPEGSQLRRASRNSTFRPLLLCHIPPPSPSPTPLSPDTPFLFPPSTLTCSSSPDHAAATKTKPMMSQKHEQNTSRCAAGPLRSTADPQIFDLSGGNSFLWDRRLKVICAQKTCTCKNNFFLFRDEAQGACFSLFYFLPVEAF